MRFFIGITPSEEIKRKIISFQGSFPKNGVPKSVEPHITVKSQGGLTEEKTWLSRVELALKSFKNFEISFEEVDSFSDDVIFLKPSFSQELLDLHKRLFEAVGPYKDPGNTYFENDQYHPHLTLGGTRWGMTKKELIEMKKSAQKELISQSSFQVNFIRIYKEDLKNQSWEKLLDIPFDEIEAVSHS
jgi:2'-5' RNA ligase